MFKRRLRTRHALRLAATDLRRDLRWCFMWNQTVLDLDVALNRVLNPLRQSMTLLFTIQMRMVG
jgi:hypothetical protein